MPSIFVAYPYSISKDDYRDAYGAVAAEFERFEVNFVYADEEITSKHILEKITGMMDAAEFSLFDITHWNANVALELGLAIGKGLDYYILWNPTAEQEHPPADIGGIDRIQYEDFAQLRDGLGRLMTQQYGSPQADETKTEEGADITDALATLKERVPEIVAGNPGLLMGAIASTMGVTPDIAQIVVRPHVADESIVTRGNRRGTRYYLPADAPPEEESPDTQTEVEFPAFEGDDDIPF
jgi:hypothetical protein